MTSLQTSIKQSDPSFFVTLAAFGGGSATNRIHAYDGSTMSVASWSYFGSGRPLSTLNSAGAVLKDMGKTVVSSLRTFRKIQLVAVGGTYGGSNSTLSTFGVGGRSGTTPNEDYLTGYIELGFEGNGNPAPVAHYGR